MADSATPTPMHRRATVANDLGLHVRPAAKIAAVARLARGAVWIEAHDERVDASDPLEIVTLLAPKGTSLTVLIETPRDGEILTRIAQLIENGFGEPCS